MSARHEAEGLKYGSEESEKAAETLEFGAPGIGQRNPQHCPQPPEASSTPPPGPPPLGTPMNIAEVAALLGCSEWTIRQRYMPQGLPCLRASATGKLVFFHKQIIDWILKRQIQQKGGIPR